MKRGSASLLHHIKLCWMEMTRIRHLLAKARFLLYLPSILLDLLDLLLNNLVLIARGELFPVTICVVMLNILYSSLSTGNLASSAFPSF